MVTPVPLRCYRVVLFWVMASSGCLFAKRGSVSSHSLPNPLSIKVAHLVSRLGHHRLKSDQILRLRRTIFVGYFFSSDFNTMNKLYYKGGFLFFAATSILNYALYAESEMPIYELKEFVVSGGPLVRTVEDFATPFTALDAVAIQRQNASTLGDLLDDEVGVSSTAFGAGASRPVIRGFEGPRVRILDSGIEALDVADTSPDHGVTVEPTLTKRVEVLRGPSTLLYGSAAIGGVVNVVGREIPRERVDPKGYEGNVETRYETVSDSFTQLGYAAVGGDFWAFSATVLDRESEDYDIPGEAEIHSDDEAGGAEEAGSEGTLENSFVETKAYSVGGTWFFGDRNYLGASFSSYKSFYGVPGHSHGHHDEEEEEHGEESVAIDLDRKRYDAELMLFDPMDWIQAIRLRLGYTDYEHVEIEGEETGTVFEREGWELRGEVAHAEIGPIDEGIIGIQVSETDFSAIGEEAFTPPANTQSQAFFVSEHIHGNEIHWDFGFRLERQEISPKDISGDYDDVAVSAAVSAIWDLDASQSFALSLQPTQRHPTSTELYANGPHLTTEQFEIGDDSLDLETAYAIDLSYRYASDDWEATVSGFCTYFEDFIYAVRTGAEMDELPAFQFGAVDANFVGIEAELEYFVVRTETQNMSYRIYGDYVRASDDDDEALPRIPPLRIGIGARYAYRDWDLGASLRHSFEQNRRSQFETDTDGFTELKVDASRRFDLGNGLELTVFGRVDNMFDEDMRYHTSFLKDVAPLPGRSLTVGARLAF